jgi:DNA-binding protein HU-beta
MNKTELVAAMAAKTGATKTSTEQALNAFMDVVKETCQSGDSVALIGFGTFSVAERAARKGKNPQTGEIIKIKACKAPKFKAGKAFKEQVNTKPKKKK